MRVLWLPAVLRGAGLTVREYPGWRTRGSDRWGEVVGFGPLRGVVCHATAGSRTSTDAGETRTLWITGSTSAPVPISQAYLSRSGEWTVGASGRCNHVLLGHKGPHKGYGNYQLLGVEGQNDNRGEPWPPQMLASYQRGVAAICAHMRWEPWRVVGHREHQDGKSDPLGVDMAAFRRRVAQLLEENGEDDMPTADEVARATIERLLATKVVSRVSGKEVYLVNTVINGGYEAAYRGREVAAQQLAIAKATHAVVAGQDPDVVFRAALAEHRAELVAQLGDDVADRVAARLTEQSSPEQVRQALREELGGIRLAVEQPPDAPE
jgi:hypothetical protein